MLHTDLSHFGISTYRPVEGSFETEHDVIDGLWDSNGPRVETIWVSYEGSINRHGELIVLKTWVDGVQSKPHSEPDWLFDEIMQHVTKQIEATS